MLKIAVAFVGLLLLVSALWGLPPPPPAGDPVELMAWIQAARPNQGANERQAPAAQTNIEFIKPRENPRDGGVMMTTYAAADWTLPPGRASPQALVC